MCYFFLVYLKIYFIKVEIVCDPILKTHAFDMKEVHSILQYTAPNITMRIRAVWILHSTNSSLDLVNEAMRPVENPLNKEYLQNVGTQQDIDQVECANEEEDEEYLSKNFNFRIKKNYIYLTM